MLLGLRNGGPLDPGSVQVSACLGYLGLLALLRNAKW